jgi:uncharacterized protein (TIGR02266 family)
MMVSPSGTTRKDPFTAVRGSLAEAVDALRDASVSRRLVARLELASASLRDARGEERSAAAVNAVGELGEVLRVLRGDGKRVTEHPVAPVVARAIHMLAPFCRDPSAEERRAAGRVPIRAEVGFDTETNFYTGFSEDLSQGGLFVATYDLIPAGTEVTVSFVLPEGHAVTAHGKVAWVRDPPDRSTTPGLGIRFDALAPRDEAIIRGFLREREAIFYEV